MPWREAAALTAIEEGSLIGVEVAGIPLALYRLGNEVFATHDICTHQFARLSAGGWVENGSIECPLHQGLFEIRTGKALRSPVTEDIRIFPVKVEAGRVFVDLPDREETAAASTPAPRASQTAAQRVVVVGAGQAAAVAIRALRAAGFAGSIDLIGDEAHLPYERPPLSKDFLLGKVDAASTSRLNEADVGKLGVTLSLGRRATAIDSSARLVTLDDGQRLAYDALLLAQGGRARRLEIPGAGLAGVLYLRTLDDAAAIKRALASARRVAIIGGGFIGLELASAARALGVAAVVLEREPELMPRVLPAPVGRAFRKLAERHGVEVATATPVEAIRKPGGRLAVVTPEGEVEADCVIIGVGLAPETALAAAAGCIAEGGIVIDAEGRTSVPGIWAAGDCALYHLTVRGQRRRLESWHNAEEQGAAAGRSIAGAAPAHRNTPWFWTDQFGINVQILGIPGPADAVALSGAEAMPGAVYRTIDPETRKLTAVVAFSEPNAIRAARQTLQDAEPFEPEATGSVMLVAESGGKSAEAPEMLSDAALSITTNYVWPQQGLRRIPDWVYTDELIYRREVEQIFHGRTWNYVALEDEVGKPGDFIRSHVGPTPVVVARAEDGSIHVFENRCRHRAAEFCRRLSGNTKEFVCPYHQWTYDLQGRLTGIPFRRGVGGKGGMPRDFQPGKHGLRSLNVTTHRGVVFASYAADVEPFPEYLGPEVLREFEATFDGRRPKVLGHYRHTIPANWKLYHENLRDPYHATLLHSFLVTFGLLVAGNKSLMISGGNGRHGVMASAKSDSTHLESDTKKEMRSYREGMTLHEPRFMDFIGEFDSPWSVTMSTIWPNLVVQREMNTLGIRQIVPTGPNEFIMKWTMFGFAGDDEEMTRHRLRQGNLMGPAGFLGLEDNEAMKFVQDGMIAVPNGEHIVEMDPGTAAGTADTLISEAAIRAMYRHWREVMGIREAPPGMPAEG